jgi:hypothetical protein
MGLGLNSCASDVTYDHLPDFRVPPQFTASHRFAPAVYLNSYPIAPNHRLSPNERQAVYQLVRAAYASNIEKYKQDYAIMKSSNFYKMLAFNFSKMSGIQTEFDQIRIGQVVAELEKELGKGARVKN